jgi:hypothetical protein
MVLLRSAGARSRGIEGAAAIAGPAARRPLVSEVPSQEHAAALLGLGLIGNRSKPPLTFVTKCLELRHDVAGADSKHCERYPDDDAALLIALN